MPNRKSGLHDLEPAERMEGAYFHGEHLRWNLGWENPNPAGAFVAMGIPWLWALASAAANRRGGEWRTLGVAAFLGEAALWFLLCKTYSRGALVAAFVAGVVFFGLACYRNGWRGATQGAVLRGLTVLALLVWTGFFSRIDPGYVAADASATNRLTLWKGGLQMIAVSPWRGWGAGESGRGFMHWFQPLDADEAYAGMVNSYLHVAVERGLPVLAGVLAVASTLLALVWLTIRRGGVRADEGYEGWMEDFQQGAGSSLLVFLVANVFSTLWIFGNLWWLPLAGALWILGGGLRCWQVRFPKAAGTSVLFGIMMGTTVSVSLWLAGKGIGADTVIELREDGSVVCREAGGGGAEEVVFLPDPTVLGETWGKEVRRLALSDPALAIRVPSERVAEVSADEAFQGWVIACGGRAADGLALLKRSPGVCLTLVHPLGKPAFAGDFKGEICLILPALDTSGAGRRWRSTGRRQGWRCRESAGVGQDVRLRWPEVLAGVRGNGQAPGGAF